MSQERHNEDVSEKGLFRSAGKGLTDLFARFGLCTVKVLVTALMAVITGIKLILRELFSLAVDIFRGSDMSLLLWSQILSWLEAPLPKVNSFLAKTKKTLKTGYRDVTSNSQLRSLYAKHRASLFSRFSLV